MRLLFHAFSVIGNRGIIGARETMVEMEHWLNAAEVPTRETRAHEGGQEKRGSGA